MSWPESVRECLRRNAIDEMPAPYRKKIKPAHRIALAMMDRAQDPDNRTGVAAAIEIADRTEGKMAQKTENVSASLEDAIREVYERIRARGER